ncbi:MAG: UvrD-helicase domain-containing protein [Verrucomicrobiota bacterium]
MTTDQTSRERFTTELNQNFSVIAPAGSGKTRAIVDRVIHIAKTQSDMLSKLAVVTYTNKAAQEMRQRARKEIGEIHADAEVLHQFNRAFFGTIHSFCLKLLRQYGHHLGLPSKVTLFQNHQTALFLEQMQTDAVSSRVLNYVSVFDILKLASQLKTSVACPQTSSSPPVMDLQSILQCPPNKNKKANEYIEKGKILIQTWLSHGDAFNPIPRFDKGGGEFQSRWKQSFAPLRQWIANESLRLAAQIAGQYKQWRLSKGTLTYHDQVELAAELLQNPEAGRLIREQNFAVILDEAQDTDPDQFRVLLEAVRPADAQGDWIHGNKEKPPRRGAFCMVGDPQQSIYGDRADLLFYQKIRERLHAAGAEELTFDITFRCGEKIIHAINAWGAYMLDGADDQASYVTLHSHAASASGQILRWVAPHPDEESPSNFFLSRREAEWLAQKIVASGLNNLRAHRWSEVAVLCPRKLWFTPLENALRAAGLDVQTQSSRETFSDSPFYRWLTALATITSQPRNHFEIVGALRDIFGISDSALADFAQKNGDRFQIASPTEERGDVAFALNELFTLREKIARLPLRDAAEQLVCVAQQRIRAIPEFENEDFRLDFILPQASDAELQGKTLLDWAEMLRQNFDQEKTESAPRPDAIQLITCQKAKGLEWDAVILPFFYRKIFTRSAAYPKVIRQIFGETPEFFMSKEEVDEEKDFLIKRRILQEHQRLLYVSLTRARHTLILIDDHLLFENDQDSFGLCLPSLEKLPREVSQDARAFSAECSSPPFEEKIISLAAQDFARAQNFPFMQRLLPHALGKDISSAEEPEQRLLELPKDAEQSFAEASVSALNYGLWWHRLCETLPWHRSFGAWNAHFENHLAQSPTPERAQKEWKLFLNSDLVQNIVAHAKNKIFHAEMPFLHPVDTAQCIEGVIDLAIFDPQHSSWLVIDWKTDVVDVDERNFFKEKYAPQLQAYSQALHTLSHSSTQTTLYSTYLGESFSL